PSSTKELSLPQPYWRRLQHSVGEARCSATVLAAYFRRAGQPSLGADAAGADRPGPGAARCTQRGGGGGDDDGRGRRRMVRQPNRHRGPRLSRTRVPATDSYADDVRRGYGRRRIVGGGPCPRWRAPGARRRPEERRGGGG